MRPGRSEAVGGRLFMDPQRAQPAARLLQQVDEVLCELPAEEQWTVRLLFGIGERQRGREAVGRRLGISRQRVRRHERRALRRLRRHAVGLPDQSSSAGRGRA